MVKCGTCWNGVYNSGYIVLPIDPPIFDIREHQPGKETFDQKIRTPKPIRCPECTARHIKEMLNV